MEKCPRKCYNIGKNLEIKISICGGENGYSFCCKE